MAHELPRGFGFTPALAVVVSSMVGGGILTTSGIAAAQVGSHWAMLALWVVGGIIAVCGALTLAELAAALPRSGGEYVILAEALGPLAAFLGGWVSLLLGFAAPIAASAAAAARYLAMATLAGSSRQTERFIASLVILAFAAAQIRGQKLAARMQVAITGGMVVALLAFIGAGLAVTKTPLATLAAGAPPNRVTWLFSLVYTSYAYTGWNGAAYIAGEVRDPLRLPRVIMLGIAVVIALYLGTNLVYALAVPISEIRVLSRGGTVLEPVEPIAELASAHLFGPAWASRLSVIAALLLLGSMSALLLTGSRVAFAMARAGQFPSIAGRMHPRRGTPALASFMLSAAALVLLWSGRFDQLIVYAGVGLALFSLLTVGAVFVLRATQPELPRPFRVPWYPMVPAAYLLATAGLSAAAFIRRPQESCLSLASILLGIPVYLLFKRTSAHTKG